MKQCLVPALVYNFLLKLKPMIKIWLLNLFFYKCGDNDTSVATFVATLMYTLDTTGIDSIIWLMVRPDFLEVSST